MVDIACLSILNLSYFEKNYLKNISELMCRQKELKVEF